MEPMPDLFWQKIKQKGWEKYFFQPETIPATRKIEIVIIRTKTVFDRAMFQKFPALKMIIRSGSGFDNIDILEAEKQNVIVCNTPEANAISAYEHTISFIMALIKQHQIAKQNILRGNWKTGLENNLELSDLNALIVGVGRVGSKVAKALQYFGAKVKGVDPYLPKAEWQKKEVESIKYDDGIKWCNLISYHCPLTYETKNYFNDSTISLLEHPIWLVNTARGGIISENAVAMGLECGKLLGFATDVFSVEPFTTTDYADLSNVLLTPHIGSFTRKAKNRISLETLEVWSKFVHHDLIVSEINKEYFYKTIKN
jgi:D-3-phosphoglycerate dehydrogenase